MIGTLTLAIGLGLGGSLLFAEFFGLAAGGMVVPGYLALHLTNPFDVALTLATGLATYAVVQALSSVIIVYGRRRTVLMILVGFTFGALIRWAVGGWAVPGSDGEVTMQVIGFIIPGLLALWYSRQGVIETTSAALTAAVAVRLVLIVAIGEELGP